MIRFTFLKGLKARFRPSKPVNAPDTVIAGQVRDWIAEGSAKALEAARPIMVPARVLAKVSSIESEPHRPDANPDYAEIIRIADALYRLAGVKK